ncbi:MAG TPA: hypothetical protein VMV05_11900 [bacterium]|nr:hypothetical protein [bacterium]
MTLTFRIFIAFCFIATAAAQEPDAAKRTPIQTKMTMGLFGILGADMEYSINGKKLENFRDFKAVIYPLGDPEAARMIHESEEAELAFWLFLVGGVAAGVDVALTFKPVPFVNVDWIDRIATGSVAVQISMVPNVIIGAIGSSDKYNAVQRYNSLVRGDSKTSLAPTPQILLCQSHPGLGLGWEF